jgi:endonuclease III
MQNLIENEQSMKNATKYAETLKSFCRKLTRDREAPPKESQDALQVLVRAAMSYDVSDHKADEAMKAIEREFVDLNEFRVATELEVQELLGQRYPKIEERVTMITKALNNIFEREHTLSLNRLKEISRRDARQFLRELPDIHPFVEAYVMMYGFDGHTFPIDDAMLDMLREEEIVEEDTSLLDAQKFVEHHLKDVECYKLYLAMRQVAYEERRTTKKKSKA